MAMLDDFGSYVNTNTSFTLGTDLYLSLMPESPDNVVVLIENSGTAPVFTLGSTNTPQMERPELQVIVRNTSYATGRSNSETLYRLLTQITNTTIGSTLYHRVEAVAAPALYDRDSSRRSLFTCNFNIIKVLSA